MYRVGICGYFAFGKELLNGQTIKSKIIAEELWNKLGKKKVKLLDFSMGLKNIISITYKCIVMLFTCRNIVILPAHNSIKFFVPLFAILNICKRRKLHYIVIGGWLPEWMQKHYWIRKFLARFDVIYVEAYAMIEKLNNLGLHNVIYMPNFKRLDIIECNKFSEVNGIFRFCTFSRVMKEKGIEDAIRAVENINMEYGKTVCILDIYGQIEEKYKDKFNTLEEDFPKYINYKGVVEYNDSVNILKDYYALLFPTQFKTEGIPGTIIDAYAAGLPVIAKRWNAAEEIIDHNRNGIIYPNDNFLSLEDSIKWMINNIDKHMEMRYQCINKACEYDADKVIDSFIEMLI